MKDAEIKLILERDCGLSKEQISEIEEGGNLLNSALKKGYINPQQAMEIEKSLEQDEIGTQIGNLEGKIELHEEGGETVLETGSTDKSESKKAGEEYRVLDKDKEELILDDDNGEVVLETKEVAKDSGSVTILKTGAVEKPEERTVTILGTPEKSSLKLADEQGTIVKSSGEDEGYNPEPVFDAVGSIFNERYSNARFLAKGGMGGIYVIHDNDLGKDVIMKVMLPQAKEHAGRFKREAHITAQIEHPNIPPVQELARQEKGEIYYMQKYVKGNDLENIIEKIDNKDPEFFDYNENRLIDDFLKVCEALEYAHFKGVIHRDLKPANIMIGEFGEAYLMDWGLAKVLGHEDDVENNLEIEKEVSEEKEKKSLIGSISRRFFKSGERKTQRKTRDKTRVKVTKNYEKTMTGAAGTPGYMAPEQIDDAKNVDARADVFAMGAILYKILTFEDAFEGETAFNKFASTYSKEPVSVIKRWAWQSQPKKILESIVNKALAKEPEDRYQSMKEMISDIRAYKNHELVKAHNYGLLGKLKAWDKRNHRIPTIAGSLLLAAGVVTGPIIGALEKKARIEAEGREEEAKITGKVLELTFDAQEKGAYANDRDLQIEKLTEAIKLAETIEKDRSVLLALPYNNRGAAYLDKSMFDEALGDFEKAIEIDPDSILPWYNIGRTYERRGIEKDKEGKITKIKKSELEKSIEAFEKAAELGKDYFKTFKEMAYVYMVLGNHAEIEEDKKSAYSNAIEAYITCTELAPKDYMNWANLGEAYEKNEQFLLAEKIFEKAYQTADEDKDKRAVANSLSQVYKQNNHHYALARLYSDFKMYDRALDSLQTAIKINDHPEEAKDLIEEIEQKKTSDK